MMKKAYEEENVEEVLKKVGKAASLAMAEAIIQKRTNVDLLDLNRRKERKAHRSKGYYTNARVLNKEVLDERKAANDKQQGIKNLKTEWNFLCGISPDLFDDSDTKQQAIKDWNAEWKSLGSISLHLFDQSRAATKRYQTAIASQPALMLLLPPQKPSSPQKLSSPQKPSSP